MDYTGESLEISGSQWEDMKELWHTAVPSGGFNFVTP